MNNLAKDEIYENLPCERRARASGPRAGRGDAQPADANNGRSKESLYATPLRKSDRPQTTAREKSVGRGEKEEPKDGEKILNTTHQAVDNRAAGRRPPNKTTNTGIPNQDPILEQRRMMNFFKDPGQTTPNHLMTQKAEVAAQANANFSVLAQGEHFANLVQQNVLNNVENNGEPTDDLEVTTTSNEDPNNSVVAEADETITLDELEEKCLKNLELLTQRALEEDAAKREEDGAENTGGDMLVMLRPNKVDIPPEKMFINREWVLKKIVICLEQRTFKRSVAQEGTEAAVASSSEMNVPAQSHHPNNLPQLGALILGSNGSGKTTICQNILDGGNGTKGVLNRRLLFCYLINSQNPECHSISLFIRSLVLQILSHSSYLCREEEEEEQEETKIEETNGVDGNPAVTADVEKDEKINEETDEESKKEFVSNDESKEKEAKAVLENKFNKLTTEKIKELEDMLISELQLSGRAPGSPQLAKKNVVRQQSDPVTKTEQNDQKTFGTHPLLPKDESKRLQSPLKKISKIPVKIGVGTSRSSSPKVSISLDGAETPSQLSEEKVEPRKEEDVEGTSEADTCSAPEADQKVDEEQAKLNAEECSDNTKEKDREEDVQPKEGEEEGTRSENVPPPLPKTKDCRTIIADSYYEMLLGNADMMDSLSVDCIEKNPDECFKKLILFPLLELNPPKNALLFLVDSIDENYINEASLMSTLKKNSRTAQGISLVAPTKSQNIAELLSQHVHLMPKWMFLVCTGKKQNKHITKMFSGFKKITVDDLRKSHVVKDVQEYIILRLNTDFRNAINLTKDVIDSLNQLYLKSNGCVLYLQKVLNGIKENFFTFREIKMLPCSLNGLYLYICQKSFNKKQFHRIRPLLNVLLAAPTLYVDRTFLFNCLRTQNQAVDEDEFGKRLELMRHVVVFDQDETSKLKIFHNSFCDWLIDVKFSTKKFLCDVNEGHATIAMHYAQIGEQLCPNTVRRFVYHLIKAGDYFQAKNAPIDLLLFLLETQANLSDCFYTNCLSCCKECELGATQVLNLNQAKTQQLLARYIDKTIKNDKLVDFLEDFFKPSLPTDTKSLKLLIEAGINNADPQLSYDSSMINSPVLSDKSQNIDSELAELLISSERSCHQSNNVVAAAALSSSSLSNINSSQRLSAVCAPDESVVHKDAQQEQRSGLVVYNKNCNNSEDNEVVIVEQQHHQHQLLETANFMGMHKGKALIHILANEGNHVLLERALRACKDPIDLEIEDMNGQTALNIACRTGHVEVVRLLLGYRQSAETGRRRQIGVDVNHADRDGWTPLRSASWGGHTEVVRLLIGQQGCAIDLADKEGRTALRAAAWSGHEDILRILIEAGADVNSVDKQGRSSLIAASYMGQFDIVEILLESGADVNHLDLDGRSALCVAALCGSSGYSRVISALLEQGAHTDQLDNDGMSPLLVSAFEGNVEICELLLENGADPDLADFMGRTPLWAACTSGFVTVVKLLLFWGCSIDCMDAEGRTVLSIATAQGNRETVRQLLDRGLDETHRDNAGWTPLHYGAFEGYPDVCLQLLESGAKMDECDNEGKTALHLAAQEGHNAVIEALLEVHGACVDLRAHDGKTALRLAAIEGHFECVQTLLKYKSDVNSKDADSRTTLYILALENKLKSVKFLLDCTPALNVNIPDLEGRTALHVAAWQGHTEMVRLLIAAGHADVNAMDLEARTPLHSCAWQGNHEVMELLLFYGAVADHACKQGATALGICAQEGHERCVAILLQYGADPFKADHCGRTPIKLAAKSNRNNVIRLLEATYTKPESQRHSQSHQMALKSPDRPEKPLILQNNHFLGPNNGGNTNATNSTQSSSNFYENTMQSDHSSSLQKRKSVISSHSTGSSNDQVQMSFTQQLQKQSRHHGSRGGSQHHQSQHHSSNGQQQSAVNGVVKYNNNKKHSNLLPNVQEYQSNIVNEADLFDLGCMSPLYATPPHSPSSEISSPGQQHQQHQHHLAGHHFEEIGQDGSGGVNGTYYQQQPPQPQHTKQQTSITDNHFTRDTHMRIILGNSNLGGQKGSGGADGTAHNAVSSKSKRSGIATNPAMRIIRDSAANFIRRTNNILTSNNQGSSSIGVKSGTFQWRKQGESSLDQ